MLWSHDKKTPRHKTHAGTAARIQAGMSAQEQIAAHEQAKRAHPRGIDESRTLLAVDAQRTRSVRDVSGHWAVSFARDRQPFPRFAVPRSAEGMAAFDEALRHTAVALGALLAADFRGFWSTVVVRAEPAAFLASLLSECPRPWSAAPLARAVLARPPLRGVLLAARDVFVRLTRREESAAVYVTPGAFADYLRKLGCFTATALVAACALFGPLAPNACDEDAFVLAVRRLLADEPLVAAPFASDLERVAPSLVGALTAPAAPAASAAAEEPAVPLEGLLDATATLAAFLRVCPSGAPVLVRAGLMARLVSCYAEVSGLVGRPGVDEATAQSVLRCLEACAASAAMHAWFARFVGAAPAGEAELKQAADELLAWLETAARLPDALLVRALDGRCDLCGKLEALAAQHSSHFPRARVDAVLLMLGKAGSSSAAEAGRGGSAPAEAFPELPVSPVDQLLSLFPGADIAKVQSALERCHGSVEDVVALVCENKIDIQGAKAAGDGDGDGAEGGEEGEEKEGEEEALGGQRLVVYRKGKKKGEEEEGEAADESTQKAIMARLERMEAEDERERIRKYEAWRLRKSSGRDGADQYADDYDDSFDDFIRYDFQDGESLDDDNDTKAKEQQQQQYEPQAATAAAAASTTETETTSATSATSARGGGSGGRRGSRRGKKHYQSDRAMSKRNRGMVPFMQP